MHRRTIELMMNYSLAIISIILIMLFLSIIYLSITTKTLSSDPMTIETILRIFMICTTSWLPHSVFHISFSIFVLS